MYIGRVAKSDQAVEEGAKKRSLAVATTYDELCGIAGFSRCLVAAIEPHFKVEVFDLDQFLLRSTDRVGRRKADAYFRSLCRRLAGFDIVNLQLEYGLLGAVPVDIFRRLKWLLSAARQVSVTFHTVPRYERLEWGGVLQRLRVFDLSGAVNHLGALLYSNSVAAKTFRLLRQVAKRKSVRLIVHTRSDRRYLEVVGDFKNVFDHPLSFLRPEEAAQVLNSVPSRHLSSIVSIDEGCKSIGVFGFLSAYKGFETAIRAMKYLPANYHLLIFGGVHPNDVVPRMVQPYVKDLMREITADHTLLDRLQSRSAEEEQRSEKHRVSPLTLNVASKTDVSDLVEGQADSLVRRVHFAGTLPDEQFFAAMASCDVIVLPYHEVGQSSSGPASLAIELGRRTLVSRTRGFLQLGRYFPNRLEYFDVGNHLQLAELLKKQDPVQVYSQQPLGLETLKNMYVAAHAEDVRPHEIAPLAIGNKVKGLDVRIAGT